MEIYWVNCSKLILLPPLRLIKLGILLSMKVYLIFATCVVGMGTREDSCEMKASGHADSVEELHLPNEGVGTSSDIAM